MNSEKDSPMAVEGYRVSTDDSAQVIDTDNLMHDALNRTYAEPEPPAELYNALAQLLQFFEEIASEVNTDSNSE